MPQPPVHRITLYTRPGCHLCEDAAELLEQLAERIPIAVVEVNILGDANLFERYRYRIPVMQIDDRTTLEAPIREADLLRLLAE